MAATPAFTPPNTLVTDLSAMLTSGYASDIALYVGHREFKAHKLVLRMRSPYWEALFASPMREAGADSDDGLKITDTEPDVFEQLLRWMYTGEVAEGALETQDMAEHCLMGANRYELGGLKLLCEAKLCEGLTVENVATRLVLGEQAEADQLKECCLEFMKPNAAAVLQVGGRPDRPAPPQRPPSTWQFSSAGGPQLLRQARLPGGMRLLTRPRCCRSGLGRGGPGSTPSG
mgnify:CR=1 FL=1